MDRMLALAEQGIAQLVRLQTLAHDEPKTLTFSA
jgi:ribonuclease PH